MDIRLEQTPAKDFRAPVLVVFGWEEGGGTFAHPWLDDVRASGEFTGKAAESILLHRPAGTAAERLAFVGAGKREKLTPGQLRRAAAVAVRQVRSKAVTQVAFALDAQTATAELVSEVAEGVLLGDYEPDILKTDPAKSEKRVQSATLLVPEVTEALGAAVERGRVLAESQNLARDLVNEPGNRLNPTVLAAHARAVATEAGLDCEVLDRDRMRQLGMGALLGVAQGSDEPPTFIILRYHPESAASADHLGLVGKGVTFDTGGVSIKVAEGMEKMKYDMAGGAAVIAAMRAIARVKPRVRVTGFVPAVENHISGRAQRPGDIVTALNGKTVEIINTDAEGRMILADALTYAARQGCTHLVDAATLTAAVVVALAHVYIGGFASDQALFDKLRDAAAAEGERIWQMPLDDDYKEYLRSAFADLPNVGGRHGGAITAAYFLKEFTEGRPWVHLDIAGTAWSDDAKAFTAKGPTGVPVRTFVRLAENW
ncbi:MAG TPA: leucyl aminopeptidase [Bryobacteraceae bacterium]|nr:leucyl aminopeptidase [Bryobacteraceae bacterium]